MFYHASLIIIIIYIFLIVSLCNFGINSYISTMYHT